MANYANYQWPCRNNPEDGSIQVEMFPVEGLGIYITVESEDGEACAVLHPRYARELGVKLIELAHQEELERGSGYV